MSDFSKAQQEVFLQNKAQNLNQQHVNDTDNSSLTNSTEDENKSLSSTFSNSNSIDENGVALELAIQKFENEYLSGKFENANRTKISLENDSMTTSVSSSSISNGTFNLFKICLKILKYIKNETFAL